MMWSRFRHVGNLSLELREMVTRSSSLILYYIIMIRRTIYIKTDMRPPLMYMAVSVGYYKKNTRADQEENNICEDPVMDSGQH